MSNHEIILCDYEGCTKPFAYRIKGFNLCSKHCFDESLSVYVKLPDAAVEEEKRNSRFETDGGEE